MRLSRPIAALGLVAVAMGGCTFFTSFDDLTGGGAGAPDAAIAQGDAASSGGDAATVEGGATDAAQDAGPPVRFCATQTDASFCEDFDDGLQLGQSTAGWTSINGSSQLSLVADAASPPSAMGLRIPFQANQSDSSVFSLIRDFTGPIGLLRCRWQLARDANEAVDYIVAARMELTVAGYDKFDVRVMVAKGDEIQLGVKGVNMTVDQVLRAPISIPVGGFVPVELVADFRGTPKATMIAAGQAPVSLDFTTTFPISAPPTAASFRLGHTYSIADTGPPASGEWALRYDDVACWEGK